MKALTLAELARVLQSLPILGRDRIRRYARLRPSAYCPRGTMYRLAPQPQWTGHERPLIVMNSADVNELRALWAALPFGQDTNNDQEIADRAEQLFAELEAKGRA